jgi:hypothetical protein
MNKRRFVCFNYKMKHTNRLLFLLLKKNIFPEKYNEYNEYVYKYNYVRAYIMMGRTNELKGGATIPRAGG